MKLVFLVLIGLISIPTLAGTELSSSSEWRMVFEQDKNGKKVSGDKLELVEAIRQGQDVRVYWRGRFVEHLANANFLTVIEGEVFAQITTIKGQKPTQKPPSVELRENEWTGIISTTTTNKFSVKWFVR